ncbi:MAG: hypothetical protein Q4G33_12440 [bacterium]|nr:hypothetical protein [bacterium]
MDILTGLLLIFFFDLIISIVQCGVITFFRNVILFDCIAVGLFTCLMLISLFHMHNAIAILLGIAIGVALYRYHFRPIAFIGMRLIMSFGWARIISSIGTDFIWRTVLFIVTFLIVYKLHSNVYEKCKYNNENEDRDDT